MLLTEVVLREVVETHDASIREDELGVDDGIAFGGAPHADDRRGATRRIRVEEATPFLLEAR
jgi:hypothetical protein